MRTLLVTALVAFMLATTVAQAYIPAQYNYRSAPPQYGAYADGYPRLTSYGPNTYPMMRVDEPQFRGHYSRYSGTYRNGWGMPVSQVPRYGYGSYAPVSYPYMNQRIHYE
jgi:hypothetical protein